MSVQSSTHSHSNLRYKSFKQSNHPLIVINLEKLITRLNTLVELTIIHNLTTKQTDKHLINSTVKFSSLSLF